MASSPTLITTITAGKRTAQLLLFPLLSTQNNIQTSSRGEKGFGSSDAYWVQQISPKKPMLTLWLDGKQFSGLVDMGANVTFSEKTTGPKLGP